MHSDDPEPIASSRRLLEETHQFPCAYLIKVIGLADEQFVARTTAAVRAGLGSDQDPSFRVKKTPTGKHVSITYEPEVASADMVLAIYRELESVPGVVMIL